MATSASITRGQPAKHLPLHIHDISNTLQREQQKVACDGHQRRGQPETSPRASPPSAGLAYGQVLRVRSFLRAVSSARFLLRSLVLPAFAVQRSVKHTIASENIAADRSGNLASDVPMPKLLNTMGLDDSKCLHACLRLGSARVVQHCVGSAAVTML